MFPTVSSLFSLSVTALHVKDKTKYSKCEGNQFFGDLFSLSESWSHTQWHEATGGGRGGGQKDGERKKEGTLAVMEGHAAN